MRRTFSLILVPFLASAADLPVLEFPEIPEWINVTTEVEPRAVGDGVADDTAALQAALDRVDGQGHTAKVIYLPKGTYRITKTLSTPDNVGMMVLGHGAATRIVWDGRSDGEPLVPKPEIINGLTSNPNFPAKPTATAVLETGFTIPTGLGNSYGARVSGWIEAPETGNYAFAVCSDDASQVRLSTTAKAEDAALIIDFASFAWPGKYDEKPEQRAAKPVRLTKGSRYFVEMLYKQGGGGEHATLAWTMPGGPKDVMIPARALFQGPEADAKTGLAYARYADAKHLDLSVMCWSNGALSVVWSGLVWDGNHKAKVGFLHAARDRFECKIQHRREAFINCTEDGLRMGPQSPYATSETEFTDCIFANNGRAGAALIDFNYYNEIFTRCRFSDNAYGIWADRYGQAFAYDCAFERSSQSDLRLSEAHRHAVRGCTSTGSKRFIEGNGFTVANCVIADWTATDGAVRITGRHGPVVLSDVQLGSGKGPAITTDAPELPVVMSHVTAGGKPVTISGATRVTSLPDGAVRVPAPVAGPAPTPATWGPVINLADFGLKHGENDGQNSACFAKAVEAAKAAGPGAVLWLPAGLRPYLTQTVVIDQGAFTLMGSGYHSDLQWVGPQGGAMFEFRDPQGMTVQDVTIVSHAGGAMTGMRQTSTGIPSRITYRNVTLSDNYGNDAHSVVRGLELRGLGADSHVLIERLNGSLGVVDSAAASIVARFLDGTPLLVENPGKTPRTGFLGILHANNGGLVVRDNLDLVMADAYCEQGDQGWLLAQGKADQPAGRITVGSCRLHLWKESPFFIKAAGYHGQITVAHADVTQDRSPEAYVAEQDGPGALAVLLMGHNRNHFAWKLTTGTGLMLGLRDGVDQGVATAAASAACDHWRSLVNHLATNH